MDEALTPQTKTVLREVAKDECGICRRGDPVLYRPHFKRYFHRLPDGKHGSVIGVPCRATAIWSRLREDPTTHAAPDILLELSRDEYAYLMQSLGAMLVYSYAPDRLRKFIHGVFASHGDPDPLPPHPKYNEKPQSPCGAGMCQYCEVNGCECPCHAEGVAAPLEPSRQWLSNELDRRGIPDSAKEKMLGPNDIAVEMLEAYAAAVSKNLTDKYAKMEAKWMRELLTVSDEIGEARAAHDREHAWLNNAATEANCDLNEVAGAIMQFKSRILELEKEITALRETK